MWQLAHCAPVLPGWWWLCSTTSNFAGRWHCAQSALPSARRLPACGSWQLLQVTPAWCIRLCRNEPYSNTSPSIWPSGWYSPGSSSTGRCASRKGVDASLAGAMIAARAWQLAQMSGSPDGGTGAVGWAMPVVGFIAHVTLSVACSQAVMPRCRSSLRFGSRAQATWREAGPWQASQPTFISVNVVA